MEERLNVLENDLSMTAADMFADELAEIDDQTEIGDAPKQRILSSVMRKAGFEMKGNMTEKRIKRHNRRFMGFMIAAAVIVIGSVSVAAYYGFFNKESVAHFNDDADTLEEKGFAANQVLENEHIRITIDTVLSDGYNGYIIYTTEALDEEGKDIMQRYSIWNNFYYIGSSEQIRFNQRRGGANDPIDENGRERRYEIYDLTGIDISKDLDTRFGASDMYSDEPVKCDEYGLPVDNLLGDMTATISFEKNCDIVSLTDSDGNKVFLSQFEVLSDDPSINIHNDEQIKQIKLIRTDGTKEEIDKDKIYYSGGETNGYRYIVFGKYIELDDYKGIELNGVEYLK